MTEIEQSGGQQEFIRCFVLPMQSINLLLPGTSVVEVTDRIEPSPVEGTPEWLSGLISWRGLRVPLISYEKLVGSGSSGAVGHIAILNTLNHNSQLPFVALELATIPRLLQVGGDSLRAESIASLLDDRYIQQAVSYADQAAYIPDIDSLEKLLIGLGIKTG